MAEEKATKKNIRVHLKGVRASFLHVFKKHAYEDNEPKYSGAFIIDPRSKDGKNAIADMEDAIDAVIDATLGGKKPKNVYCLSDGNDEDRSEYADMMIVRASNKSRPKTLDRNRDPLHEDDGKPYSGCYVNAIVDVYAMPKHKSVQATLMGVQFVKDGEPLSGGHLDDDEFEDMGDDDDEGSSSRRSKRGGSDRSRSRDDGDDDERPSRRSRDRDSDDDGDRRDSRRSGRDRNRDDDEDDRPRRSRSRDEDEDDDKPKRSSNKRRDFDD